MFGCALLWTMAAVAGGALETVMLWSRELLVRVGVSMGEGPELLLLHLQFGGLGFVSGAVFRFYGLRKQLE